MKYFVMFVILAAGCSKDVDFVDDLGSTPDLVGDIDLLYPDWKTLVPHCTVDPCSDVNVDMSAQNNNSPDMSEPSNLCADVVCPDDQVCSDGACSCTDTSCTPGNMCVNGLCQPTPDMSVSFDMTDPCAGITCLLDQVCTNGQCACNDTSCDVGSVCVDNTCQSAFDMSPSPDLTDPCANVYKNRNQ